VFGDTVYFLALVNPTDQFHRQALVLSREPPAPLVTTESAPPAGASSLGRRLVLQCQGGFLSGQPSKLLGAAHDRTGVGMRL
jgi:hypothetical protein